MSDNTRIIIDMPLPRPGLQTFIHHLFVGILKRYPFWHTIRMAWKFRNLSAILSIEPLTAEELERIEQLAAELKATDEL